jgi:serine/threonine protein phosphatase 1
MHRQIFVGDVHGQFDGLRRLWDLMVPDAEDRVYFVGDLIDRGPQSAEVVSFVRQHSAGCVRGNHEQLLLDAFVEGEVYVPGMREWLRSGGQSTVENYKDLARNLEEDIEWIRSLPLYIDLGNVWLVHAGLNPNLPLARQSSHEFCWVRRIFHSSHTPYFPDKQIITGHTMTFTFPDSAVGQIAEGAGWSDIDTGAYDSRSGWLTGLDWDNQMVYQVNVFDSETRVQSYSDSVFAVNLSYTTSLKEKRRWWQKVGLF